MIRREHERDGLLVVVERSDREATICFKGTSDARSPGDFLNPLALDLTKELKNVRVTVDLRELEFMNSGTVLPLINLIRQLDANGRPVRVLFSNADWQRCHRRCMTALACTLSNVKVEEVSL